MAKGQRLSQIKLGALLLVSSQVVTRAQPSCVHLQHGAVSRSPPWVLAPTPQAPVTTPPISPCVPEPCPPQRPGGLAARGCPQLRHKRPAYQMLSLSATATHGVKGWNLTTEGTPGFLLRNIWSSSLAIPAQRDTQRWASTYSTRDDVVLARPKPRLPFGDLGGHGGTQAKQVSDEGLAPRPQRPRPPTAPSTRRIRGKFSARAYQVYTRRRTSRAQTSAMR